jgi:hypothetical protein
MSWTKSAGHGPCNHLVHRGLRYLGQRRRTPSSLELGLTDAVAPRSSPRGVEEGEVTMAKFMVASSRHEVVRDEPAMESGCSTEMVGEVESMPGSSFGPHQRQGGGGIGRR